MRRTALAGVVGALVLGVLVPGTAAIAAPMAVNSAHHQSQFFVWTRDYQDGTGTNHLVVADADGRNKRVLTHPASGTQDIDPRISPDGNWVLFEHDTDQGPAPSVVKIDGTGEQALQLPCSAPCVFTSSPSWAPGGHQVVYNRSIGPFDAPNGEPRSNVLFRSDLDGRHLVRLSQPGIDGIYEDSAATFSPGGYMVFLRLRVSDLKIAIFRTTGDVDQPRQLTPWSLDGDLPFASPARSGPTKDLVVFETYGEGAPDPLAQAVATVPATCQPLNACTRAIRLLTRLGRSRPRCTRRHSTRPGRRVGDRSSTCCSATCRAHRRPPATSGPCASTAMTSSGSRSRPTSTTDPYGVLRAPDGRPGRVSSAGANGCAGVPLSRCCVSLRNPLNSATPSAVCGR